MAAMMPKAGGRRRYAPLAEINVTPMVDVMLVLLIIFMVAAPLMNTAVNVDLPKTTASPVNQENEPLNVSVDAQGKVFLQNEPIDLPELVAKLTAIAKEQKDRRIFVRGDKANTYGTMMEVMGTIIQGGFTKVSLLTDPSGGQRAATPVPAVQPAPAPAPSTPATSSTSPARPTTPARPPGRG